MSAAEAIPNVDRTIGAQIEEVEREIKLRKSAYPRWVQQQKMRQSVADEHMLRIGAVLKTLQRLRDAGEP